MENFILDMIKEYAKATNTKAVVFRERSITYKELDDKSDWIAKNIKERVEGKSNVPIIIYESRGIDFIVYMIAVIKSGCYYIPIELNTPVERVKIIYEDVNAALIITNNCESDEMNVYSPKDEGTTVIAENFESPVFSMENIMYIIYTSGTTGKPKGVKILYRNLYNLMSSFENILYHKFSETVNVGVMASFSFDASVKQIYSALYFGHTLVVAEDKVRNFGRKMHDFHNKYNLTVCDCTPSHLKLMTKQNVITCSKIKYLLVGGEKLTWKVLKDYSEKHEHMPIVINVYGPTECCVDVSYNIIEGALDKEGSVPIGKPVNNTKLWIVDKDGNKLKPGDEEGELWIEGEQVGDGYVNIKSKAFIKDAQGKNIIYKTGDLAKYNKNGEICILLRIDRQTKINGYRIELDEISSVIEKYIKAQAYVVIKDNVLYAFVTKEVDQTELKKYLKIKFPPYMIPRKIISVGDIPLNYNGKVDEKKLLLFCCF